jgi:hypothetical protein
MNNIPQNKIISSFTGPSGTTPDYSQYDVICNSATTPLLLVFNRIAQYEGGGGVIKKAQLFTDKKDCTAQLQLVLFNSEITAVNDNEPFLELYSNYDSFVGFIDFPPLTTKDATNSTGASSLWTENLPFLCTQNSKSLYGILINQGEAFTRASLQNYKIILLS